MKKKKIRSFDEEFKRAAVARLHSGEAAVRIAFDLKIPRKLLYDWKRRVEQGTRLGGVGRPAQPKPTASPGDHIAYLERLVGQLTHPMDRQASAGPQVFADVLADGSLPGSFALRTPSLRKAE